MLYLAQIVGDNITVLYGKGLSDLTMQFIVIPSAIFWDEEISPNDKYLITMFICLSFKCQHRWESDQQERDRNITGETKIAK
jgi:hypothetical protein